MKIITTSGGKKFKVDDWNYDWLSKFWWVVNGRGYAYKVFNDGKCNKAIYMARMVVSKKLDRDLLSNEIIDHINRKPNDNQECNLRIVSKKENSYNRAKIYISGVATSNYKGVRFTNNGKYPKPWLAALTVNGNQLTMCFSTEIEAAKWRDEMAKKYHGEFAVLNF